MDSRRVAVHPAERGGLQSPGQKRNVTREPHAEGRLVETDELVAEIAERICGRKENKTTKPVGMPRSEHDGDCGAVRVTGYVGFVEPYAVHKSSQAVVRRFQSSVQPRNPV